MGPSGLEGMRCWVLDDIGNCKWKQHQVSWIYGYRLAAWESKSCVKEGKQAKEWAGRGNLNSDFLVDASASACHKQHCIPVSPIVYANVE